MVDSRKDLLLNNSEAEKLKADDELKLKKTSECGGMYYALVNSPGWKDLMENFINHEISQEMYLNAEIEKLADVRAAQKKLFEMLQFINGRVDAGQKAFEFLKNRK